ncbi:unnamed protein product, partial [Prorocentrum cordatum]
NGYHRYWCWCQPRGLRAADPFSRRSGEPAACPSTGEGSEGSGRPLGPEGVCASPARALEKSRAAGRRRQKKT